MSHFPYLTAFLALASVGGAPHVVAQSMSQHSASAARPAASDSVDRALVALLSKADQGEIAQVRQAAPTLKDPDVKKYAQMLIEDHTKDYAAITAIGAKLGYPTASHHTTMPPAEPMPPSPKPYDRPGPSPSDPPAAAWTANPDREFIEAQITGHQQVISQLPANDSAVQNAELRAHLAEVRRVLSLHLSEARRLRDKVAGAMP